MGKHVNCSEKSLAQVSVNHITVTGIGIISISASVLLHVHKINHFLIVIKTDTRLTDTTDWIVYDACWVYNFVH